MLAPQIPGNELLRLAALESYNILDTLPETEYDNITRIASIICNTPTAMVSLIDDNRQFFKSRVGLDSSETPREFSFCAHAINKPDELMVIPDSRNDERFINNPFVTGAPGVIFYAGMPLVTPEGYALGTLCVIDTKPRHLSTEQKEAIKALANQTVLLLDLRKKNEALLKSRSDLAAFALEMEAFAWAASHDLKEPLRTVKSFINLLEKKYEEGLDDKAKQYIHFAVDGINKMEILIKELLEYSTAGKINVDSTEIDLNDIIKEIKQLLTASITEKNAVITCSVLPKIYIARAAIMQVFQNLIANAVKYQSAGIKPVVLIDATANETHWQFSVTDNGIGIAQNDLESIFTIFKRLNSSKEYSGTGIGLAICKKIVENNGGKIWVKSEEGRGSTFYFTIAKSGIAI